MFKRLFVKAPTVEEFREYVVIYMKSHEISIPKDSVLIGDKTDGFGYAQVWKSVEQQKIFIARCKDVRKSNPKIDFDEQAILTR